MCVVVLRWRTAFWGPRGRISVPVAVLRGCQNPGCGSRQARLQAVGLGLVREVPAQHQAVALGLERATPAQLQAVALGPERALLMLKEQPVLQSQQGPGCLGGRGRPVPGLLDGKGVAWCWLAEEHGLLRHHWGQRRGWVLRWR